MRRSRFMSDRYLAFANSTSGRRLVSALGLPAPLLLERWMAGRSRPVDGALLIGGEGSLASAVLPFANKLTDALFAAREGQFDLPRWTAEHGPKLKALVFDASGLTRFEQLIELRDFFQPAFKGLDKCPRVVILGRAPESLKAPIAASVQRSLEGFSRSLGKEIRRGGNVQLIYVGKGGEAQLEGALRFFLSAKSAWSPVPRVASVRLSPKPWPATAPRWCCWTYHRPKTPWMPWPHAWAGAAWPWTSAPMMPPHSWSKHCRTASTLLCTTPASP